jgi:hypothetical protein
MLSQRHEAGTGLQGSSRRSLMDGSPRVPKGLIKPAGMEPLTAGWKR